MEVAKITAKGQITIPVAIRRQMKLKDGDKVLFIEDGGRYYVENAALVAINRMQEAFADEAERLGLKDEDDVVTMVREIRHDRWGKRHADILITGDKDFDDIDIEKPEILKPHEFLALYE